MKSSPQKIKKIGEIKLNEEESQALKEIIEGKAKIRVIPNEYYWAAIKSQEEMR